MTTGQKIRRARVNAGLLQRELAERVHLCQIAISSYETGRNRCTVETLCDIARALEVPAADLLPDEQGG